MKILFVIAVAVTWYTTKHIYYTQGYIDGLADASKVFNDLLK